MTGIIMIPQAEIITLIGELTGNTSQYGSGNTWAAYEITLPN